MADKPKYPGVFIEEGPSGPSNVGVIGVASTITAFIGRTAIGPINEPVVINSLRDFEWFFGGLALDYPLSYAVSDFFMNGGSQAIVVRLFTTKTAKDDGKARLTVEKLPLVAANPGTQGNNLVLSIDSQGITDAVAQQFDLTAGDLFNLTVGIAPRGPQERFLNLSVKDGAQRIDKVLAQQSHLIRVQQKKDGSPDLPDNRPKDVTDAGFDKGTDSLPLDLKTYLGSQSDQTGLYALEKADLFNLLCIPPDVRAGDTDPAVYQAALACCVKRRAMLIVDPPVAWNSAAVAANPNSITNLNLSGVDARNAAIYFPRVIQKDPLQGGQPDVFAPCGIIAGVIARTDVAWGVWKAPAGLEATLNSIQSLAINLTDQETGEINPLGINCLRTFSTTGPVVWGARTMRGADRLNDDYKYLPVRRLTLFIEESLERGTQWVVFEPNDEPLWARIRSSVGAFMRDLFGQGAFQGQSPGEAYFVKCDNTTTTQNDIDLGVVNIVVGFAPLKPAEFTIINLQQKAGNFRFKGGRSG